MSTVSPPLKPAAGKPAWELAYLFPPQGSWTEEDYLELSSGNHLVELTDGWIEVLPMPTILHQLIMLALYEALRAFVRRDKLGMVLVAGTRVRLGKRKFREPDVVFVSTEHADRVGDEYCEGADLVMEVVSGSDKDRKRDLKIKPNDYAKARIPEYWIVDPKQKKITVLRLSRREYKVHGEFGRGTRATSALLDGFEVDVDDVLAGKQ